MEPGRASHPTAGPSRRCGLLSRLRDTCAALPRLSPSDPVPPFPRRTLRGHVHAHRDRDRPLLHKRMGMLERRERRALPVCRRAAHGAFTTRHARFHVRTVLAEIVARAALRDAPSGIGRLLVLLLLLRLDSTDGPERPNDREQPFGATAAGPSAV